MQLTSIQVTVTIDSDDPLHAPCVHNWNGASLYGIVKNRLELPAGIRLVTTNCEHRTLTFEFDFAPNQSYIDFLIGALGKVSV